MPLNLRSTPPETTQVVVPLPLASVEDVGGYCSRHLCIRSLSTAQAAALKRLALGLDAVGARCKLPASEPRRVLNREDAIRWLLDQIAEASA